MVRTRLEQQSESGLGPAEKAEDYRQCQQWYDPVGSGTQVTGVQYFDIFVSPIFNHGFHECRITTNMTQQKITLLGV